MKISLITSFPFLDGKATSNRIKSFVDEMLVNNINSIEVICLSNKKSISKYASNVVIRSLKSKEINKNNFLFRSIIEIVASLRLYNEAKKNNPDIIVITIPSIFLLTAVLIPKKQKFIVDVRDIVWGYFGNGFFSNFLSYILKYLFIISTKQSLFITTTNPEEQKILRETTNKSVHLIRNGISVKKFKDLTSLELKSPSKFTNISYIGNIGIAQQIEDLVDYAKQIPEVIFNIVGDGARYNSIKIKIEKQKIKNVILHGLANEVEVVKYIENSDILFAQIGENFKSAIPTKIFEYICSGRKILLGLPDGQAKKIFTEFRGVEIFQVGSKSSFFKSFNKIKEYQYTQEDREYNLSIITNKYLREAAAKKLVKEIMKYD